MATKNVRSIEEQVEDWCKTQLRSINIIQKTKVSILKLKRPCARLLVKVEVKEQTIRI